MFVANDWNAAVNQRQNNGYLSDLYNVDLQVRPRRYHTYGFRTGGGDDGVIFTVCGFRAKSASGWRMCHIRLDSRFSTSGQKMAVRDFGSQFAEGVCHGKSGLLCTGGQDFFHGIGKTFVHVVKRSRSPVNRLPRRHLTGNGAAVRFPLPDFVDKRIAAVVVTGFTFFSGNLALNHHLGRDRRGRCRPATSVYPLHTLLTDHGIHAVVSFDMSHMQTAGDAFGGGIMMQKDSLLSSPLETEIALLFPINK